jgi:hypothetical protein
LLCVLVVCLLAISRQCHRFPAIFYCTSKILNYDWLGGTRKVPEGYLKRSNGAIYSQTGVGEGGAEKPAEDRPPTAFFYEGPSARLLARSLAHMQYN